MLTTLPAIAVVLTIALLAAIALNASVYLRGPAPWPPEWRWSLRQAVPLRGLPGTLGFSTFLAGLMFVSATRIAARRPHLIGGVLLGATTLSCFALQFSLIAMEDGGSAIDVLVKRTASPSFTSYYTVAVSPICRDIGEFVRKHAALLPVLPAHARTHALGPILYYRAHLHVLEQHRGLADAVLRFASSLGLDPRFFSVPDQELFLATAVTGVLLLMLMSSLSCIAVAALARALDFTVPEAIRAGIIWAVVPGLALMVPEFDQFLVLPVTSAAALLVISFRPATSNVCRALTSIGAGVMGGAALLFSYGAAIFLAYGGLVAIAAVFTRRPRFAPHLLVPTCIAASVSALVFFLPSFYGHDSLGALRTAIQIHHREFTEPRSYYSWIVFNLWDTIVFLGFPLAVFWIHNAASSIRSIVHERGLSGATVPALTCVAATAGVLLIDLAGVVRGETGRIWIPLMPFLLISALAQESPPATKPHEDEETTRTQVLARPGLVFVLLVACCLVIRRTWHIP
jgi:hypothetical protein